MNNSTSNSASLAVVWILALVFIVYLAASGLWPFAIGTFIIAVAVTCANQAPER